MATKTEIIRKGLIKLGFSSYSHSSHRECFHKSIEVKDGGYRDSYVWLLSGTLRGNVKPTISDSRALPNLTERAYSAGLA